MKESQIYGRTCSRRGCPNIPSIILEVAFLHKRGAFCKTCAEELLQDQLVRHTISSKEKDNYDDHRQTLDDMTSIGSDRH
ncbi:MAG: hypothetical protein ACRD8W_05895 [Nitrososphaeraceae archaeon]